MPTKTRDRDELEGALLPPPPPPTAPPPDDLIPLATVVAGGAENSRVAATAPPLASSVAAVPVDYFDERNTTGFQTRRGDDDDGVPAAPFLPSWDASTEKNKERAEAERVRVGQAVGTESADAELTDIERARGRIYAAQYRTKDAIKTANKEAKRRDREGLKVTEDKYFRPNEAGAAEGGKEDPDIATYGKSGGGYEVAEYETSEYETREYDTSEYKSVYD